VLQMTSFVFSPTARSSGPRASWNESSGASVTTFGTPPASRMAGRYQGKKGSNTTTSSPGSISA